MKTTRSSDSISDCGTGRSGFLAIFRRVIGSKRIGAGLLAAVVWVGLLQDAAAQPAPVNLGTASNFEVLAGSGITNTGPTTIRGDVGTFPTTSITGFETVTLLGVNHGGDAVTQQAKNDLVVAYNDAAGRAPNTVFAPAFDLGGLTLVSGVYNNPTSFGLTGTLTLDAEGNRDAVFIFQAGSTLTTASNSTVTLINGAEACNVFWQVGSSATLGTNTTFAGSILALTSITLDTGATVDGRVLARNGAVVLDTNTLTLSLCTPEPTPSPSPGPTPTPGPDIEISVTIEIPDDSEVLVLGSLVLVVPEDQFPAVFTSAFYESLGIFAVEQVNAQNQFMAQRLSAQRLGARSGFESIGIESPIVHDKDGKSVVDGKSGKSVLDVKDGKNVLIPADENKWGIWVQGNGIFGRVTNVSQVPNSDFQSGGVFLGGDYRWNEYFTTGIFGGYQGLYSKYTNGARTTINSALFGVYATYQNDGYYSDLILTGGYSNYRTSRPIQFATIDSTAKAAPDGGQFSVYWDHGYDWKVGNFTFGPIVGAQYTYVGIAPFTENGAGSLNLQVAQQNINSLRSSLGGHIAYTWNLTDKIAIIPEIRMFWQHEFLENSRNIDASLDSGNIPGFGYQTTGPGGRDSVYAGAGIIAQIGQNWNAYFYYNADFGRQDYLSHAISGGLNFTF